jgi:predicted dehydrogenase
MPRRRNAKPRSDTRSRSNPRRPPLRFAVIGQGHFAQSAVLPAFANADGCELHAIFSDDETKLRALKRKYGVAAALGYGQYVEYLHSREVDAVYIALPNDLHAEYAIHAARAGVHVLCEKPLAVNAQDAERIAEACAENRVKLMVAYRLHFEAANLEAIERVKRGDIGRARYFSSTFSMQVRKGDIRTQRERGGGPLLDIGIYCVNAVRNLFRAEPISAVAFAGRTGSDPRFREVDEQVSAVLRFPDERLAQLTCSFGAYDCASLSIVGDKGSLTLDPAYKQPEPSGEEGVADLRVLDAIQRSLESGRVESIEPVRRTQRPSKKQEIRRPPHDMPDLVNVQSPTRS